MPPDPFADELPPDFWGDDPILPEEAQNAQQSYPNDAAADSFGQPETRQTQGAQSQNVKPLTGPLERDPRFVLLTELFPGHITSWQSAETPTSAAADDAEGAPETVDLEAGLDADEPDET